MSWRRTELAQFGEQLDWLTETAAAEAYANAKNYWSTSHYGLESSSFTDIERCGVR